MAMTRTKTKVVNLTRNELMQGTARRFLDIASDTGANCEWYYERLEVMTRMQLVTQFELIVMDGETAVGGVALRFDWDKHTALVQASGEFIDPDVINRYGATDSITDTLEAVRTYVTGLVDHFPKAYPSVWYSYNEAKVRELGRDRFDQILGRKPRCAEDEQETDARWAKISAAKAAKARRRVSTLGDLPETSIDTW
ncbi:MAG: hypothetical protein AAF511_02385 [Pseudomonadota bacterium]